MSAINKKEQDLLVPCTFVPLVPQLLCSDSEALCGIKLLSTSLVEENLLMFLYPDLFLNMKDKIYPLINGKLICFIF